MEGRLPIIGRPRRRRVVLVLVATAAFTPAAVGQVAAAPIAQAVAHGSAGAHHETAPDGPAYRMTDVGTFGGPSADVVGPARQMTPRGAVIGIADTTHPDADSPNAGLAGDDPYLFHAFAWYHGRLHDLGALPGENSSVVQEVNGHGLGVGGSETGAYDPRAHAPAMHTVLFRSGKVIDLGTLPGGSESFAVSVTEEGVVAGVSNSAAAGPGMPDFFDWGGQIRSFVWKDGRMRDLGTLGGPGTVLVRVNEHGVVAGDSYVGSAVDADTGYPTLHPFLWRDGRMRDLGGFGGGRSVTRWLNERGQVTGYATLPGDDAAHPFLWDGRRLRDLGTLGGSYASGEHVDDRGDVAGFSTTSDPEQGIHTFLWRAGRMSDLSPDLCSYPEWINNRAQVVGGSCDGAALLWQSGRQYDLNALVGPTSVQLTSATYVSERGDIVAVGVVPSGDQHVFLLRPTGHRAVPRAAATSGRSASAIGRPQLLRERAVRVRPLSLARLP